MVRTVIIDNILLGFNYCKRDRKFLVQGSTYLIRVPSYIRSILAGFWPIVPICSNTFLSNRGEKYARENLFEFSSIITFLIKT